MLSCLSPKMYHCSGNPYFLIWRSNISNIAKNRWRQHDYTSNVLYLHRLKQISVWVLVCCIELSLSPIDPTTCPRPWAVLKAPLISLPPSVRSALHADIRVHTLRSAIAASTGLPPPPTSGSDSESHISRQKNKKRQRRPERLTATPYWQRWQHRTQTGWKTLTPPMERLTHNFSVVTTVRAHKSHQMRTSQDWESTSLPCLDGIHCAPRYLWQKDAPCSKCRGSLRSLGSLRRIWGALQKHFQNRLTLTYE